MASRSRRLAATLGGVALFACVSAAGAHAGQAVGWQAASAGLPPQPNVLSLAVDGGPGGALYTGLLARGIHRSTDGGRSWVSVTNFPVLAPERIMSLPVSIVALAVEPGRPGEVSAGTSAAGLLTTLDAGGSWRPSNRGLRGRAFGERGLVFSVDAVAVSPDGVRYASIRGRGVYRSPDLRRRWSPTGRLPNLDVQALEVHPRKSSVVYAATLGGVYISRDGGRRWRRAGRALRGVIVQALVVHPRRAGLVYAATRGAGVFVTRDGGDSWAPFNAGLGNRFVLALELDVRRGTLYAGTLGGVFARSLRAAVGEQDG